MTRLVVLLVVQLLVGDVSARSLAIAPGLDSEAYLTVSLGENAEGQRGGSGAGLALGLGGHDVSRIFNRADYAMLADKCVSGYGCRECFLGLNDRFASETDYGDLGVGVNLSLAPLPAAAWLFASALFGFVSLSNRRRV